MDVLVIGDVMLDIYQTGKISRISPEAPVPVLLNAVETAAAGGAANVAVNISSIGLNVALGGIIGQDKHSEKLSHIIYNAGITPFLLPSSDQPTVTKCRVIGNGHHLVRMDFEGNFQKETHNLFQTVENIIAPWVVLSDYDKGSLHNIQPFIQNFKEKGSNVIVDPKRKIEHYQNAWLIKPNQNEFIKYIGEFSNHQELIEKARVTLSRYNIEHMLITLGSEGMMYVHQDAYQYFPSRSIQVADITGAGDTVLAGLVFGLVKGKNLIESIQIAQKLAELSVTKIGTYVLTADDIKDII